MLTQIIFFTAVALLIVILVRRVKTVSRIGSSMIGILASVFKDLTGGLRRFPKKSLSRPERNRSSNESLPSGDPSAGHQFWHDEMPGEKHEISSNFEEGEELYRSGKLEEAERFFVKAAATSPNDPKIYARLGLLYLNQKNYSDAIESLKVAVKIDKYNPSRHYNLALAYWGNKDLQRAIASVREAISLDPVTKKYRQLLEKLLNGEKA
jgi:tetratricopeptide (TPR) repeat protein